jgi:hypothetical protein
MNYALLLLHSPLILPYNPLLPLYSLLITIIFINFNTIFSTSPAGLKLDLSTATPPQLTPHTIEFTACPSHSDNPMVDVEWTKNSLLHSSKFEEEKEETI